MLFRLRPVIALLLGLALFAASPVRALDADDDGIPNKYDECKKEAEDKDNFQDTDGCPDPDNDKDGVCDPGVAQRGQGAKFAGVCRGADKCVEVPEDRDGFEDEDGCPDPDNDRDGIPDAKDKCPSDAEDRDGFEDNDGCPDADNDKDGLMDAGEKCPMAAEDKDGIQDDDGCPETDGDNDGIKDEADKCPMEPETLNGREDEDGCADRAAEALQPVQTLPLVRFRTGTDELTLESHPSLDALAKQLQAWPEKKIEIRVFGLLKGGKKEPYLDLLGRQTRAVADYLMQKGVNADQLQSAAYTVEALDAGKGLPDDFNQSRPAEVRLLN